MREPEFWYKPVSLAARLGAPLGYAYYLGGFLKRVLARAHKIDCPVICVGNATIGGAGKTPVTDMLATALTQTGYRPAILSRGYGGRLTGPLRVRADHMAQDVGDEPCLLAQRHAVYIGADRRLSAALARQHDRDVLILDDGYQNGAVFYDLRILVVDGQRGFGNEHLIPAGPLREPWRAALARADGVVINQGQPAPELVAACERHNIPIFSAVIQPKNPRPKAVYAFCGIANPNKFTRSLDAAGYDIKGTWFFDDHHPYTEIDARTLLGEASKRDAHLITTEKDAMRLRDCGGLRQALLTSSEVFEIELTTTPDLATFISDRISS